MKNTPLLIFLITVIVLSGANAVHGQLRSDESKSSDYSGPIVKQQDPSEGGHLGNLFNMQMGHSYSVNFSSFGGQVQNFNAYTNTMQFFFSENLTGRVDLSLIHSPFGNNSLNGFGGEQEVQFILRNAELNYQLGENSSLRLQFNQYPTGYGYRGFGSNRNHPFQHTPIFGQQ